MVDIVNQARQLVYLDSWPNIALETQSCTCRAS